MAGLLGAAACLAERLAGPVRHCGPPAVALAVMALMASGAGGTALVAGACAVAGACVWTALAAACPGARAPAVVDLATMALMTAAAARAGRHGPAGAHPPGMRMDAAAGAYDTRFFLFLVACWALARAGVRLTALVGPAGTGRPLSPGPRASTGGRAVLRELGSAAMVVAMAAMLA
ncbi:hypothetical protein [Actinacidiphila yanglinensis]|uniref:hypothetical protein n=1 Tax=Actinacidiphila yanglinensis TaxID=310779 RepID=UPI0011B00113|nr:hypothetical protein [Actinacidiphila yanglinensis]